MSEKKDKRSAILVNLLRMEINSSLLEIIHELWGGGNNNVGSSSTAKLMTSKGRIEVRRIGDPLFCGIGLS